VDAVLRSVQTGTQESQASRSRSLRVRLGSGNDRVKSPRAGLWIVDSAARNSNSNFKAIRAAFDDRSIRRGIIVAESKYIACQTWIEGTFVCKFTQSPAGSLPPNDQRVVWDLLNIFRFEDQGRLVEDASGCDSSMLAKCRILLKTCFCPPPNLSHCLTRLNR
jgi:hypothetical protein